MSLSIIKEEELSDQEENFINSQSFDPLASSKISNEIENGGFPEAVSITDIKDIKLQEEYLPKSCNIMFYSNSIILNSKKIIFNRRRLHIELE